MPEHLIQSTTPFAVPQVDDRTGRAEITVPATQQVVSKSAPVELWAFSGASNVQASFGDTNTNDISSVDFIDPRIVVISHGFGTDSLTGFVNTSGLDWIHMPAGEEQMLTPQTHGTRGFQNNSALHFAKRRLDSNPGIRKIIIVRRCYGGSALIENEWAVSASTGITADGLFAQNLVNDINAGLAGDPDAVWMGTVNDLMYNEVLAGLIVAQYAERYTDLIAYVRANVTRGGSDVWMFQGTPENLVTGNDANQITAASFQEQQLKFVDPDDADYIQRGVFIDVRGLPTGATDASHFQSPTMPDLGARAAAKAEQEARVSITRESPCYHFEYNPVHGEFRNMAGDYGRIATQNFDLDPAGTFGVTLRHRQVGTDPSDPARDAYLAFETDWMFDGSTDHTMHVKIYRPVAFQLQSRELFLGGRRNWVAASGAATQTLGHGWGR
ncbi:MAG: hypothetical protein AAFP86_08065, partial [Planctomycetota bacterium]